MQGRQDSLRTWFLECEGKRAAQEDLPADQCAGVRWLEGRALDLTGDPLGAIAAYERAVATGEDHRLALIGLAGFRADAGDALEAVALLRRAGITIETPTNCPIGEAVQVDLLEVKVQFHTILTTYANKLPTPESSAC